MKLVSYNIQYGLGSDGRYDLARIAGEVADADIIALQEVDRFWQRSGCVDSPRILADLLGDRYWVYGANLDMDASYWHDGALINRRRQFGTMILSRWPILSSRNFPLPKWGDVAKHSIQQGLLEAVIAPHGRPIRVYSVHLSHLCSETRLPQVHAALDVFARAASEGGAWCGGHENPAAGWLEGEAPPMPREMVLMGDLNCGPASLEYTALVGPMSPEYGRLVNREGLCDAWCAAGHDEDSGRTHPNNEFRIDHILVSSWLTPAVKSFRIDDSAVGSDHWPLWLELDWP